MSCNTASRVTPAVTTPKQRPGGVFEATRRYLHLSPAAIDQASALLDAGADLAASPEAPRTGAVETRVETEFAELPAKDAHWPGFGPDQTSLVNDARAKQRIVNALYQNGLLVPGRSDVNSFYPARPASGCSGRTTWASRRR